MSRIKTTIISATTLTALAALLALTLGGRPAAATAAPRLVPVFAHFQDDGTVTPSTIPCPGGQAVRGRATFGVRPGDTWQGTAEYDFCLKPGPIANTLVYSGTGTFTGSVTGCGTGTMKYNVSNGFVKQEANPTTPNGFEQWQVVSGGGTGGLAGVSAGQGIGIFTILPTLANNGFFAGAITC